jgi:hypothetical protein
MSKVDAEFWHQLTFKKWYYGVQGYARSSHMMLHTSVYFSTDKLRPGRNTSVGPHHYDFKLDYNQDQPPCDRCPNATRQCAQAGQYPQGVSASKNGWKGSFRVHHE